MSHRHILRLTDSSRSRRRVARLDTSDLGAAEAVGVTGKAPR